MIVTARNSETRIVIQYESEKNDISRSLQEGKQLATRWNAEETRPNMIVNWIECEGQRRDIIKQKSQDNLPLFEAANG